MSTQSTTILFPPGRIAATPNALDTVSGQEIDAALMRHLSGDWGELCETDRQANQQALRYGDRLLSAYQTEEGTTFWIITEADRSATTVLLPEDY